MMGDDNKKPEERFRDLKEEERNKNQQVATQDEQHAEVDQSYGEAFARDSNYASQGMNQSNTWYKEGEEVKHSREFFAGESRRSREKSQERADAVNDGEPVNKAERKSGGREQSRAKARERRAEKRKRERIMSVQAQRLQQQNQQKSRLRGYAVGGLKPGIAMGAGSVFRNRLARTNMHGQRIDGRLSSEQVRALEKLNTKALVENSQKQITVERVLKPATVEISKVATQISPNTTQVITQIKTESAQTVHVGKAMTPGAAEKIAQTSRGANVISAPKVVVSVNFVNMPAVRADLRQVEVGGQRQNAAPLPSSPTLDNKARETQRQTGFVGTAAKVGGSVALMEEFFNFALSIIPMRAVTISPMLISVSENKPGYSMDYSSVAVISNQVGRGGGGSA